MSEPIICVDSSQVHAGKLEPLRAAIVELVAFVEANEPRPIAYGIYLAQDGAGMTVVQVHPDSASMEFHMKAAGPLFPRFSGLITLTTMDIYGKPSERLLDQLRRKAELLGKVPVRVHDLHAGVARFGPR